MKIHVPLFAFRFSMLYVSQEGGMRVTVSGRDILTMALNIIYIYIYIYIYTLIIFWGLHLYVT